MDIISYYQWLRDSMCSWLGQVVAFAGLRIGVGVILFERKLMQWFRHIPLILALRSFIRHLQPYWIG